MGRSNGRSKNTGRRGRKHRASETKQRLRDGANAKEARVEHDKRRKLAEFIVPRIQRLCARSIVGIVVQKNVELIGGKYPLDIHIMKLCANGLVKSSVWDVDRVDVRRVTYWHDLSSVCLETIKKADWKPVWPKNILDRIVEATG